MDELVSPRWNWLPVDSNKGTNPNAISSPPTLLKTKSTPTHNNSHYSTQAEVQLSDLGIWQKPDGQFWPVVVLQDNMVPDAFRCRQITADDATPVFFLSKNDIHFVPQSSVERKDRAFFDAKLHDPNIEADVQLWHAVSIAANGRSGIEHLESILAAFEEIPTDADVETHAGKKRKQPVEDTSNAESRHIKIDNDLGHTSGKRSKPDSGPDSEILDVKLCFDIGNSSSKTFASIPDGPQEEIIEQDAENVIRLGKPAMTNAQWRAEKPSIKVESDDEAFTEWTTEEDAEIIRLFEDGEVRSLKNVRKQFLRKFPTVGRSRDAIRCRYDHYLQPGASVKCNKASKEVCDLARSFALSMLDTLLNDSAIRPDLRISRSSEIIQISWPEDSADLGSDDPLLRNSKPIEKLEILHGQSYNNYDIPEHPEISNASGRKWTAEEDAHLILLVERYMENATWTQRAEAWNIALPHLARTQNSMASRYMNYLTIDATGKDGASSKDCQILRDQALAFELEFGEHVGFADACQGRLSGPGWTTKEDAELVHLREHVIQTSDWQKIATKLRTAVPGSSRTAKAVAKRYCTFLVAGAIGKDSGPDPVEKRSQALDYLMRLKTTDDEYGLREADDIAAGAAYPVGQPFTTAEDAELIRLKERVCFNLQWDTLHQAFKKAFPDTRRSVASVKDRYNRFLARGAAGGRREWDSEQETKCRRRAIAHLDGAIARDSEEAQSIQKQRSRIISLLSDSEDEKLLAPHGSYSNYGSTAESSVDDTGSNSDAMDEEEANSSSTSFPEAMNLNNDDDKVLDLSDDEMYDESHNAYVTFIIGEEHEQFRVPVTRVLGNSYILEDTVTSNEIGAMVTGARWNRIKSNSFQPIYEYLKYGDFRPRLRDGKLSGLSRTPETEGKEIVRGAALFALARQMQLWEMMQLICQKFRLMRKQPLAVLFGVKAIFKMDPDGTEVDALMRNLMIEEVVKNHPLYLEAEATKFWALQERYPAFVSQVIERLAVKLKQVRRHD